MAQVPVIIALTPAQRALIRESSGKEVTELGIEPVETGLAGCMQQGAGSFGCSSTPTPNPTRPPSETTSRASTRDTPAFA